MLHSVAENASGEDRVVVYFRIRANRGRERCVYRHDASSTRFEDCSTGPGEKLKRHAAMRDLSLEMPDLERLARHQGRPERRAK